MIKTHGLTVANESLNARARSLLLCGIFILGSMTASIGQAKDFLVTHTSDSTDATPGDGICETATGNGQCTLRAAIQESNAFSSTDKVLLPAGEYILSIPESGETDVTRGDLNITQSLTIEGAGAGTTLINGNGGVVNDRVLHITGDATVTIKGTTIKGGRAVSKVGGGIYLVTGTLTLQDSIVSDNTAVNPAQIANGGNGGGIYVTTGSTLNIFSSTITRNISDSNERGIGGGGIFNAGALRIENSSINANLAINSPSAGGGGLQNQGGDGQDPNVARVTIIDSTISSNNANVGGGIRNLYGAVNLENVVINNNSATTSGGGLENSGGGMLISHATIRNNSAGFTGGGISNFAAMDVAHSAIYENTAGDVAAVIGQGAGIYNSGQGALSLLNTTVSKNTGYEGGGIYNHRTINLTNSTIYNNTSSKIGSELIACGTKDEAKGQDCSNDSSLVQSKIVNTIIGNASGVAACGGHLPLITSKGYNIDTGTSCGFTQTTDKNNIFASTLFVDNSNSGLITNNGLTPNYALLPNSAAHNAGDQVNCPLIDQRNYLRDATCDIGAYEISTDLSNFQLADLKVEVVPNPTQGGGAQLTFTVTITNKGPNAATNVVLSGKLPPWGMPLANSMSTNNGGTCALTPTGFTCNLGTINAYASAQVYIVVFPEQEGTLVLEADATSDQVDTFRPDSNISASTSTSLRDRDSPPDQSNFGNFSGKGGSLDWTWATLLLIPAARRWARRH